MLRRLAHPQATKQFARSFQNISLHRLGHQPLSNRLYLPTVFGVTRLSRQGRYLNVVGPAHGIWGGQVAGFHSTRRNEGLPVVPVFAAVLKVRLSRLGAFLDVNSMLIGIWIPRTRANRG